MKIALQTVERHGQIGEKDGTRLRIALREVATIEKVLTDVLEWARPGELQNDELEALELATGAIEALKAQQTNREITLTVAMGLKGTRVRGDRLRLTKALMELLANAADASPADAPIRVELAEIQGKVQISVQDSGRGLTEEETERAFDPFFSTKARGVGLGLPRARAAARNHGGDVTVHGRPEGGAVALLWLPVTSATNAEAAPSRRKA